MYLVSDFEYQDVHGEAKKYDTIALTNYNHKLGIREIWFSQTEFNLETVIHELLHAHLSYTHIPSRVKSKTKTRICEEVEELIIENLDGRIESVLNQAKRLYRRLIGDK